MTENLGKSINDYDFFELLGLNFDQKEKENVANRINELIWKEFLLNDLEEMVEEKDIEVVNSMAKEKSSEDIVTFIIKEYPQLKEILLKIATKVKKEIILTLVSTYSKSRIREKRILYTKAKKLIEEENWHKLYELMGNISKG